MYKTSLCICYPTFNRGQLFVNDICELLENKDSRFCISIVDNCSSDGSYESLKQIQDNRLHIRRNDENIGGIANTSKAVRNSEDADYILFCLDKDKINNQYLSSFIDFLEKVKPHSGYVELYPNKEKRESIFYRAGFEATKYTSFLSKHPSGFFWKREDVEVYIKNISSKIRNTFPFWMDILQGYFAYNHDSYILYIPLITHAPYRKDYMENRPRTLTYNKDNIYFSLKQRINAFENYLDAMEDICPNRKERVQYEYNILINLFSHVSIGLIKAYSDKGNCWHYNVEPRNVGDGEIIDNIINSLMNYLSKSKLPWFRKYYVASVSFIRWCLSFIIYKIKLI